MHTRAAAVVEPVGPKAYWSDSERAIGVIWNAGYMKVWAIKLGNSSNRGRIGVIVMGLNSAGVVGVEFLGTRNMTAVFHCNGKCVWENKKVIMR